MTAAFLNITSGPPPLVASFSASCNFLVCSFNGSSSSGAISSYQWNFGDATGASGATASHTYAAAGSFSVTLTVGDGTSTNTQTQTVTVAAAPTATVVPEVENNNTRNRAQLISPNPARVNGAIGSSSDTDYYRVSLAAGRTLSAALTPNASSNYNLTLYNANGSVLASSALGTGQVDRASVVNNGSTAATVYVRVLFASGGTGATNGRYTLDLAR